ncbi:hypothetical protein V2E24_00340 [Mycoplasmopsis ciconiae]|uniref:Uncharacterized protein n=1 Tax=Mycoplasmopsis ciconiae TaxID=561067 RepID=A0ABU7MM24_9BACT|nr:hypothetical protein [Mycoplasmopsis ciconiae]
MNKKLKTTLYTSSAILGVATAIGAGFLTSLKETRNVSNLTYQQQIFYDYTDVISEYKNTDKFKDVVNAQVSDLIEQAHDEVFNQDSTNEQKQEALDKLNDQILQNIIDAISNPLSVKDLEFLEKIANSQSERIREITLKENFTNSALNKLNATLELAKNNSNVDVKKAFESFVSDLNETLKKQNQIIVEYNQKVADNNTWIKEVKYPFLATEVQKQNQILNNLLWDGPFRENSLENQQLLIENLKQQYQQQAKEYEQKQKLIEDLIKQNQNALQNINNPELEQKIKDAIFKYPESINSLADADELIDDLQQNLTQWSDSQKPSNELKDSINSFVKDNLNNLDFYKKSFEMLANNLVQASKETDNSTKLAQIKRDLVDAYNQYEKLENKVNELNSKIDQAIFNSNLAPSEASLLKDKINQTSELTNPQQISDVLSNVEQEINQKLNLSSNNYQLSKFIEDDIEFLRNSERVTSLVVLNLDNIVLALDRTNNDPSLSVTEKNVLYANYEEAVRNEYKKQVNNLNQIATQKIEYLESFSNENASALIDALKATVKNNAILAQADSLTTTNKLKELIIQENELLNKADKLEITLSLYSRNSNLVDYLNNTFSNNIIPYDFTVAEQTILAKSNQIKEQIDELNSLIYSDNSLSIEQIEQKKNQIIEQQNHLYELAQPYINAQNTINLAKNALDSVDQLPQLKNAVNNEYKALEAQMSKLEDILVSDEATSEVITQQQQKIKEAIDNLEKAKLKYADQIDLDITLQKINEFFPDDKNNENDSIAEESLRQKWATLKEQLLNPSTTQDVKDQIKQDLFDIRQIVEAVKKDYDLVQKLQQMISFANGVEHGNLTDIQLESSQKLIEQVNEQFSNINSANIPNLQVFLNYQFEIQDQTNNLELAVYKDRIVKNNKILQSLNINAEDSSYAYLKSAFSSVNDFATDYLGQSNIPSVIDASEKISALIPLFNTYLQAYELEKELQNNNSIELLTQLKNLLASNPINPNNSVNVIDQTKNNIESGLSILKNKVILKSLTEELKTILIVQKNPNYDPSQEATAQEYLINEPAKAIFANLLNQINNTINKFEGIYNLSFVNEELVLNAINEAKQKLQEYRQTRLQIIEQYEKLTQLNNDEINKIDQLIRAESQKVDTNGIIIYSNFTYQNYDKVVAEYKAQLDTNPSTMANMQAYLDKFAAAFNRDLTINYVKYLNDYVNGKGEFAANSQTNPPKLTPFDPTKKPDQVVQSSQNTLIEYLQNITDNANSSASMLKSAREVAFNAINLAYVENKVTKQLNKIESNPEKETDYQLLYDALVQNLPDPLRKYSNLIVQANNLQTQYDKLVSIEELRVSNFEIIGESANDSSNASGLYAGYESRLNDANLNDPQALEIIKNYLSNIYQQNNLATTKNQLENISQNINSLKTNIEKVSELSQKVHDSLEIISSQTPVYLYIQPFISMLNVLIAQSREAYIDTGVGSIDKINNLIEQLDSVNQKTQIAISIYQEFTKAAKINAQNNLNYYQNNGVEGSVNNETNNQFLNNILLVAKVKNTAEILNEYLYLINKDLGPDAADSELVDFNMYLNKAIELSNQYNTWASSDYAGEQFDAQLLLNKLWEFVVNPRVVSENATIEQIYNNIDFNYNNLSSSLETIIQLNNKKNETNQTLINYTNQKLFANDAQKQASFIDQHNTLYQVLNNRVSNINSDIVNSESLNNLQLQTNKINELDLITDYLVNLDTLVNTANTIINSTAVDSSKVNLTQAIQELKQMITFIINKYNTYSSIEDIENDQQNLNNQLGKVNFFVGFENIKSQITNNSILNSQQKEPILAILNHVSDLANEANPNYPQINEKYLQNSTQAIDQTTKDNEFVNTSVLQILNDSVKLQETILVASQILALQDSNYDSAITKQNYSNLQNKIEEAKNILVQQPVNFEINEEAKFNLWNQLNSLIIEIRDSKKTELNNLYESNKQLLEYFTNPLNNFNVEEVRLLSFADVQSGNSQAGLALGQLKNALDQSYETNSEIANMISTFNTFLNLANAAREFQILNLFAYKKEKLASALAEVNNYLTQFDNTQILSGANLNKNSGTYKTNLDNYNLYAANLSLQNTSDDISDYQNVINTRYNLPISTLEQNKNNFVSSVQSYINKFLKTTASELAQAGNEDNEGSIFVLNKFLNPYLDQNNNSSAQLQLFNNILMNDAIGFYANTYSLLILNTLARYNDLKNNSDAISLSTLASQNNEIIIATNQLLSLIYSGIKSFENSRSNLNQIINQIAINASDSSFNLIKEQYSNIYNQISTQSQSLNNLNIINMSDNLAQNHSYLVIKKLLDVSQNTSDNSTITLKQFYEWPENNKNLLLNFLNMDISSIPNQSVSDYPGLSSLKRYQYVVTKKTTTKKDLISNLIKLGENTNEIDITNAASFLNLFNAFAFTQIGLGENNTLASSPYNSNELRVIIKKLNDNSWYENVPVDVNSDLQKIKIKVKYSYTPTNLQNFSNLTALEQESEIVLSFDKDLHVQIPSGTSSIFYQTNDQNKNLFSKNAKVEVLDLFNAGLISDSETTLSEQRKQEIIKTIFSGFKNNVLGAADSDTNVGYTSRFVQSVNPNSQYSLSILNQLSYTVSGYVTVGEDWDNTITKVFGDNNNQEIQVLSIVPAKSSSYVLISQDMELNNNRYFYENPKNNNGFSTGLWFLKNNGNLANTMPQAVINLYKFKFTIENGKLYMYISYFETQMATRVRDSAASGVDQYSPLVFANELANNISSILQIDSQKGTIINTTNTNKHIFLFNGNSQSNEDGLFYLRGGGVLIDENSNQTNADISKQYISEQVFGANGKWEVLKYTSILNSGIVDFKFKWKK